MDNVFDITSYGAIADGKTDCTKAIQNAIDDASKVKGAVVVPPGEYLCGYIKLAPSISFLGYHGWGYRERGGSVLLLNDEKAKCLLDMTGAHGSTINGIQFLGNKLMGENVHGILVDWNEYNGGRFDDYTDDNPLLEPTHRNTWGDNHFFREDNFIIADCQCKNFSGDGIHLNHIFAFTICDCELMSNGRDGIHINGWDGWIHDCVIHTNNGAGIGSYDQDGDHGECCKSITITGNRIEWNHNGGIFIQEGDSLNINNNFFDRSGGPAIKFKRKKFLSAFEQDGISDITITGNIFRRSGKDNGQSYENKYDDSHIYLENCSNMTVTGNVCVLGQDDGGIGTYNPSYSFVVKNSSDCVILGNAMKRGHTKRGIIAENNDNVIIKDNIE